MIHFQNIFSILISLKTISHFPLVANEGEKVANEEGVATPINFTLTL